MRAGTWLTHRDLAAARASWQHARDVGDRLPGADPQRAAMRIAPRTLLCGTAWMAGGGLADTGFDELRDLATAAGDKVSLAMAMGGWLPALIVHSRFEKPRSWPPSCEPARLDRRPGIDRRAPVRRAADQVQARRDDGSPTPRATDDRAGRR